MKLLIFSPYYPPHIGGLESYNFEFSKHLSENGFNVIIFTPQIPLNTKKIEFEHTDVKIIRFPAFEIISNYPVPKFWSLTFWKLFFSLFKKDFDIVISSTRFFLTSLLALIFSKTTSTKWIHIEHGSDFVRLSSKFKSSTAKLYDYTFGYLVFKFSDINISISKAVQDFIYKFDKRNAPIIYRGLDFKEIDSVEKNKNILEKYKGKTIITFVGRLYKWKGVENSIKAIQNLPKNIQKKIVFLIIGDGEDFERLKHAVNKSKNIEMLGYKSRTDTLAILKSSDIYIHSAHPGGGLSTSLLEAMYTENIIVATPNEGAKEVVENDHNGILIEKSHHTDISQAIEKILKNKNYFYKFAHNAKITILEKINWQKSIDKYIKIINEIFKLNKN